MSALISVVIPTYNRSSFIERTVRSVLDQTHMNTEVIVIDDGSTDDTRQVLQSFHDNPAFRYVYQPQSGRSRARNHGADIAKGEWIMYLDSDDYLLPLALETLYRLAGGSKSSDLVYANFQHVGVNDQFPEPVWLFPSRELDRQLLLELINGKYWLCKTGTYLVRKKLVSDVGGFVTGFEPSEDLDYTIKMLMRSKASFTNEVVLHVQRHPGNTSEADMLDAIVRTCKYYLLGEINWPSQLDKQYINKIRFALRYKLANCLYELDRHGQAFGTYVRLIGGKPHVIFDKFVFKQFFATLMPPAVKRRSKFGHRR